MLDGRSQAQLPGKFPFDLCLVSALAVSWHCFDSNICSPWVHLFCAALPCGPQRPQTCYFLSGLQSGKPPVTPSTSRQQVRHTDSFAQLAKGGGSEAMQVQASDLFVQTGDALRTCSNPPPPPNHYRMTTIVQPSDLT